MSNTPCPPPDRLRQLLDGLPSAPEQTELELHLEDCADCRQVLEALAAGDTGLVTVAAEIRAAGAPEPALDHLLTVLQTDSPESIAERPVGREEWVISFLGPSESPDALGKFGGYDVLGILGQGGMGIVLKAFDPALRRTVALKVLVPHLAGDALARRRFAREAQAAAAVRHEHVVTIHAVDEAAGLPFLVMEYLAGGSLQEHLAAGPLDARAVVTVGLQAAEGLAAAHAQGLVHRDVKPSNILLSSVVRGPWSVAKTEPTAGDGEVSATDYGPRTTDHGPVKITDFGLARAADDATLTQTGVVAGTPMYMAPEQAKGGSFDHRADLFSLGSVLYRLCTGRDPFTAATPLAVLRQVCEEEPRPIAELNPQVPRWLVTVIGRLMAKRPEDRFASAAEVADLLRRYRDHLDRPDRVPPPSVERGRPGRSRVGGRAAMLVAVGLLLAGGLGLGAWLHRTEANSPFPKLAELSGHTGPVWSVAFAPDGRTLVSGGDDGTLRFWDVAQGKEVARVLAHVSSVYAVAFGPAGRYLASGSDNGVLKLWSAADRRELLAYHHGSGIRGVATSPDGKTVAVGGTDQHVELIDVDSGKVRLTLTGHGSTVVALAFRPDGAELATSDTGGTVKFWDVATGAERMSFAGDPLGVRSLAFAPDGATLAAACSGDRAVRLWDVEPWRERAVLQGHTGGVLRVTFSPDGRRLASSSRDGTIRLWDPATEALLAVQPAHNGSVWALAFAPDGRTLASAGEDKRVRLWDVAGY
jgi:serine/threonine protein kinase